MGSGIGFSVRGSGFRGHGFRVMVSGLWAQRFRVKKGLKGSGSGSGFRVWGSFGFRILGLISRFGERSEGLRVRD